jgi:hypothetical protein
VVRLDWHRAANHARNFMHPGEVPLTGSAHASHHKTVNPPSGSGSLTSATTLTTCLSSCHATPFSASQTALIELSMSILDLLGLPSFFALGCSMMVNDIGLSEIVAPSCFAFHAAFIFQYLASGDWYALPLPILIRRLVLGG